MDPITHALLGASIGYVAFEKKLGRTAALTGAAAALLPDADVFIRSANDPLLLIEFHRHFTHALLFAPIGAAIAALAWIARRAWRPKWLSLWLCCLIAYLSHCFLDAATSYGTQLAWPFSSHRAGWDFISIIDPIFTIALAVGLTLALKRKKLLPAIVALSFCSVYVAIGAMQHARAASAQQILAQSRGHTIERFEVMPTLGNNLVWRALYLHQGQIHSDRIRVGWFSKATAREGWSLPVVSAEDLTEAEREQNRNRSFERFNWFSEGWVARSPFDSTVLGDMRYSLSTEAFDPIWGIRFLVQENSPHVEWVTRSRDRRVNVKELWKEISGHDPRYRKVTEAASLK